MAVDFDALDLVRTKNKAKMHDFGWADIEDDEITKEEK
mgnify:CR=1 FL=1